MSVIVITGSRGWTDADHVRGVVDTFPERSTVICGGARGADQIAEAAARLRGHKIVLMKADWEAGKLAGFARNLAMLDQEPDLVVAFWLGNSKGTKHTIHNAMGRGIPVQIHWRKSCL